MNLFRHLSDFHALELILFAMIIVFYYMLNRKRKDCFPTPPTPPTPRKIPIIGHLHLLTETPHHALAAIAKDLGPIVYLQLGQIPTIIISSPDLAKLVLKTYDHVFANRPQLISAQYLSFGCSDVTFLPYGPYWRQVRKIVVTELLSSKRVRSFQDIREEEVDRMTRILLAREGKKSISAKFFGANKRFALQGAFGKRFKEDDEFDGEGKSDLARVLTESQELFAGFCLGDFFPRWWWVDLASGYKKRLKKTLRELRRVCDEIIDEHLKKKESGSEGEKEDFLDVLIRVQQRGDSEVPISDDNLKALVLDVFIAGTDTTAASLEWVMTELLRNPKIMKKAQEEVRKITSGTKKIDESDLDNLYYIKAVIRETMRLHPLVPLLVPRESMEKCNLGGYEIPARTRILVNAYAIGQDPTWWENPHEFNPERFIESEMEFKDQDFRYLPFGGGRRGCPGYMFALATVEITIARLLCYFDWALPHGVEAEDVNLDEIFGLATRKKYPVVAVPSARKV